MYIFDMIMLSRNEAARFCAFHKLSTLSPEGYRDIRETVLLEKGFDPELPDRLPSDISLLIRRYFEHEFHQYTNQYLSGCAQVHFELEVSVMGKEPIFHPCVCCGYRTIEKPGEYLICQVCFWEDDDSMEDNGFSGPNKMTLGEAKQQFAQFGAMDKGSLTYFSSQN